MDERSPPQDGADAARETLLKMKDGDREAFDRFFEHHSAKVLVYINYNIGERLRRKMDPTDILQNLHYKIFKNFESFINRAEKMGIKKVLIRMADHEITEAYRYNFKVEKRDAKREITAAFLNQRDGEIQDPLHWVPSDSTSITARVVRQEEYQHAMDMLSVLTPLEQVVTIARVIEGISAHDIAKRLGKTRGAIQMLISRSREKLREHASKNNRN